MAAEQKKGREDPQRPLHGSKKASLQEGGHSFVNFTSYEHLYVERRLRPMTSSMWTTLY